MPQPSEGRTAELTQVQSNARPLFNEIRASPTSLYSQSPNPRTPNANNDQNPNATDTPRQARTSRGLWGRRWQPFTRANNGSTAELSLSSNPAPINYSPATQPSEWGRQPVDEEAPPVPAISQQNVTRPSARNVEDDDGDADVEAAAPSRSRRHKKRKRTHHKPTAWIRRHGKHRKFSIRQMMSGPARTRFLTCVFSGLFLLFLVAIYLGLALSVKNLNRELHILFILAILATTSFFCHTMVSLCTVGTIQQQRRRRPRIPSIAGPMGFRPDVPIRVHLARDDEILAQREDGSVEEEKIPVKPPPPAYGLWRCSVRVDPNLLHWRRVDQQLEGNSIPKTEIDTERQETPETPETPEAPETPETPTAQPEPTVHRPPSYVSEDGVTYIMEAQPRTTVYFQRPPSELHPAFRNQGPQPSVPLERCA